MTDLPRDPHPDLLPERHSDPRSDPWADLRRLTPARIALGRSGNAQRTRDVLAFGLAHAHARDAVHVPLDVAAVHAALRAEGFETLPAASAAADRATYLLRPDLGRRLDAASAAALSARGAGAPAAFDLLPVVGDGLSSLGVARHAVAVLVALRAQASAAGLRLGPVVVATQARVALADDIGERLDAPMVAMLIGERPGLSSPDSLGIYLTHAPRVGRSDAERNCISNIRAEGLPPVDAARRLVWLVREARRLGLTGVGLKDRSEQPADALPDQSRPAVGDT